MAFELGDNPFAYSVEIFEKYKTDRLIFVKTLQVLQYYQCRNDFPYCLDEMAEAASKVLGGSLISLFFCGYIFTDENAEWNPKKVFSPKIEEPLNLVKGFADEEIEEITNTYKADIQSFILATSQLKAAFFTKDSSRFGIKTIATYTNSSGNKYIKLVRNDDASLELEMDDGSMHFLIEQIKALKNS